MGRVVVVVVVEKALSFERRVVKKKSRRSNVCKVGHARFIFAHASEVYVLKKKKKSILHTHRWIIHFFSLSLLFIFSRCRLKANHWIAAGLWPNGLPTWFLDDTSIAWTLRRREREKDYWLRARFTRESYYCSRWRRDRKKLSLHSVSRAISKLNLYSAISLKSHFP